MNVCGNRDLQFLSDGSEDTASGFSAWPPEGIDRGPVGLVVGSLENKGKLKPSADLLQAPCHVPGKFLVLEATGAKNKERSPSVNFNILYLEGLYH